jgi:RNA polymerase-binding transcription factor DksA
MVRIGEMYINNKGDDMFYDMLIEARARTVHRINELQKQLQKIDKVLKYFSCQVCGLDIPEYSSARVCTLCMKELGQG